MVCRGVGGWVMSGVVAVGVEVGTGWFGACGVLRWVWLESVALCGERKV